VLLNKDTVVTLREKPAVPRRENRRQAIKKKASEKKQFGTAEREDRICACQGFCGKKLHN